MLNVFTLANGRLFQEEIESADTGYFVKSAEPSALRYNHFHISRKWPVR